MRPFTSSFTFTPDSDIPDLSSKVIIVTGGNSGTGKQSVLQLAKHHPGKLYLAARSKSKAEAAIADIVAVVPTADIKFLELDLASFESVKRAADTILASNDRLDILINNAGVMALPAGLTADGYEIQFGTNHMGHALFTKLLLPLLSKTAAEPNSDVRIINLSSAAHNFPPRGGFLPGECTTDMKNRYTVTRYGQSKLANILFTKELARRYPNIKSVAIHPGRVQTALSDPMMNEGSIFAWFQRFYDVFDLVTVEEGTLNQLWAATGPKKDVKNGEYYTPVAKGGCASSLAKDSALAAKLWDWTEAEFAKKGL